MPINLIEKYKPLYTEKTRYFYVAGSRGSGKSFAVTDFAIRLTYEKGHKVLFTRYTMTAAEKSIIPEFQEKIDLHNARDNFSITKDRIINKTTGSEILFSGIKTSSGNQTANLKSLQGVTAWIYDEFEEHPDEDSFDTIDLSIRKKGIQNRIILLSNALHMDSWQYKRFFQQEKDITHIHTTYLDNKRNLDQKFLDVAERVKQTNIVKYKKHFLGEHYRFIENALWTNELIIRGRPENLDRVVVAIDPAVTANKDSDESGLIVVGRDGNKGYVLEDASGRYTPQQWGAKAVKLYDKWAADRVIGEVNNGGDMIENVLRNIDNSVSFRAVRATRGKNKRAEPIVSLYEQGQIYHTRVFADLEFQMTTWNPQDPSFSPDRMDALVWGLTELFIRNKVGWVL